MPAPDGERLAVGAVVNAADLRARLVAQQDRASRRPTLIERLDDLPTPPGFTGWRVNSSAPVVLPTLLPSAPLDVHERYLARVLATATGECPLCEAVAAFSADPEHDRNARWHALPVTFGIRHLDGCPTQFGDAERHHFDPRAFGGQP